MYRIRPKLKISNSIEIIESYENILDTIFSNAKANKGNKIAFEAYPSLDTSKLLEELENKVPDALILNTDDYYISADRIYSEIQDDLTDDEVFGRFSHKKFADFLDPLKLKKLYEVLKVTNELIIVVGVGATEIIDYDLLVYLDINRWEIQKNYKKGLGNWRSYKETNFSEKLKRSYYFEWPAATEIKDTILAKIDYYIDMNVIDTPKMVSGKDLLSSLKEIVSKPIRMVPFFEPGIWGGHWMQDKFGVGQDEINLAWCFDGVPEENSIILSTDTNDFEMPAQNLVLLYPIELMGEKVFGKYGRDFPIRFNLLDTVGGQNLSLQVHPTLDYAYRNFGAKYTQDESYYVLDTDGNAKVYLGVKDGVDKNTLVKEFERSQTTGKFDDEKYINVIPMEKHDHYLIPGGTIHSSGAGSIVLEISSTPNRFTFKLWDWGRTDLNGKPRPISLHHGRHVLNTDINETFVANELYNQHQIVQEENGFREEHTGLHELEAIETRILTFSKVIQQTTKKSANMLCLVEGEHIQVQSTNDSFKPFDIYYGETFIIPENVKSYKVVPLDKENEVKVIKAYIR
ncbi:class I mannose-6-phosphate isomerase [Carnobacteriaceae bacterium 52-44]